MTIQNPDEEAWEAGMRELAETIGQHNTAWTLRWPKHCSKCGGWGGYTFTQRHDEGPGETLFDVCDALPEKTCHRCGQVGLGEEEDGPCTHCGWNYDDGLQEF